MVVGQTDDLALLGWQLLDGLVEGGEAVELVGRVDRRGELALPFAHGHGIQVRPVTSRTVVVPGEVEKLAADQLVGQGVEIPARLGTDLSERLQQPDQAVLDYVLDINEPLDPCELLELRSRQTVDPGLDEKKLRLGRVRPAWSSDTQ